MPESTETNAPETPPGQAVSRILRAALDLFSSQGFDAVSMNAVANAAGVSKANIFHHFRSKHELYIAALREACRESRDELEALNLEDGSIGEQLADFAVKHLASMLDNARDTRLILREVLENAPGRAEELARDVFHDGFDRLVETVRLGQRRGELDRDLPPAFIAVMMLAANVFFAQSQDVLRHLPGVDFADDPKRYSRMYMQVLLRGAGRAAT
ncbi:TetR/AcrR family transcriptional regulator [Thioalkalivibrio thiocyanodenitrificans]|uniref:TetR/AcrR family transcriptional regulator n=1 Tax=Thioalkalivibrio thiocyanodenitrificans TaxID=243063 RepID=UPI0003780401|nr:TetR/AcrR family transcriptional regulator [Thioalkalivibrio thiocyanodenitrificans]